MPSRKPNQQAKFRVEDISPSKPEKIAKYACPLILNHNTPAKLTQLEKNPYLQKPALEKMQTTEHQVERIDLYWS